MVRARHYREAVVDQRFLHHVLGGERVAQRSDQHVELTVAQGAQKLAIGRVDEAQLDARGLLQERVAGGGQDLGARQRHRADRDPGRIGPRQPGKFVEPLVELGAREHDGAGKGLGRRGQLDALAARGEELEPGELLEITSGPVHRRLGDPERAGSEAEIARLADRDQRPELGGRHPLVEVGDRLAVAPRREPHGPGGALGEVHEHPAHAQQQHLALGRGKHPLGAAVEQHHPDPLLEPGNRLGHRRLAEVDPVRRGADPLRLGNFHEGTQVPQVWKFHRHGRALVLSSRVGLSRHYS